MFITILCSPTTRQIVASRLLHLGSRSPVRGAPTLLSCHRKYLARRKHIGEAVPARKLLIWSIKRPLFRDSSVHLPVVDPFPSVQREPVTIPPRNLRCSAMRRRCPC